MWAIQRMAVWAKHEEAVQSVEGRFKKLAHSMVPHPKSSIAPIAIQHTISEFLRSKHLRALPALVDLLGYPDVRVRLRAIEALGFL